MQVERGRANHDLKVSLGILLQFIDITNRNNDKLPHAEQSNTAADIIEEILLLHLVADVAINYIMKKLSRG